MNSTRAPALVAAVAVTWLCGCYTWLHPMPRGTSYAGPARPAAEVEFLADITWVDAAGERHVEQRIFDAVLEVIGRAERFILVDMFLWNDFQGEVPETTRALSRELADALIARKRKRPGIEIIAISDPVNTVYGALEPPHFRALEEAGVPVVLTRLDRLRDSNPSYSWLWRITARPLGQPSGGLLPSPFNDQKVNTLSYLQLLNFKANHRR